MTTTTEATTAVASEETHAFAVAAALHRGQHTDNAAIEARQAEEARIVHEATGGDEGAAIREAQASQAEQELIDGQKRSAARIASLRQATNNAVAYDEVRAKFEAVIADQKSTLTHVVAAFVAYRRAFETSDRIFAYGNQAIAGEMGVSQGPLREPPARESMASVLDRYAAARIDTHVSGQVNAMLTEANDAYNSAVK